MLPGASGSRWMPRKIAGSAMSTIEPSSADMKTAAVVFDEGDPAVAVVRERCGASVVGLRAIRCV